MAEMAVALLGGTRTTTAVLWTPSQERRDGAGGWTRRCSSSGRRRARPRGRDWAPPAAPPSPNAEMEQEAGRGGARPRSTPPSCSRAGTHERRPVASATSASRRLRSAAAAGSPSAHAWTLRRWGWDAGVDLGPSLCFPALEREQEAEVRGRGDEREQEAEVRGLGNEREQEAEVGGRTAAAAVAALDFGTMLAACLHRTATWFPAFLLLVLLDHSDGQLLPSASCKLLLLFSTLSLLLA